MQTPVNPFKQALQNQRRQIGFWLATGLVLALFVAAIGANAHLFALFLRANGILFALGAIAFHQFAYLYASAAFVACRLGWSPGRSRPST